MPGLNITRNEAESRSTILAVHEYEVTLDLTHGREIFISKTLAKFSCSTPGAETFIDAVGNRIINATLNGAPIDTSTFDGTTLIVKNLAAENELVVEIEAVYSKAGEGLQLSVDPVDDEVYLYSQGETAHIRRMYPCFDQPDLKAIFTLTAIAPSHWEVISNSPVAAKSELDGKNQWIFQPTPRISTYITAMVAGPYSHVHDEYVGEKTIPLGIYCRKSLAESLDPENIFKVTKQGFKYFETEFGLPYPFEKYDQLAVVDYNWGAMENAGCVTFLEELLVFRSKATDFMYERRAMVILHEMAHMWFGNLVTMQWWNDLWLNESFAEWAAYTSLYEGTEFKNSWAAFNSSDKTWAYMQDQFNSTHPIITVMDDIETVAANFDGISYAKGASVLKQLSAFCGRDEFLAGLRAYFKKHAWGNTTFPDLVSALEEASGKDLTAWVDTWLRTAGVNTLRPKVEYDGDTYKSVSIEQEAPKVPANSTELRPHRMAVGLYDFVGEKLIRRLSIDIDAAGASTTVDALTGQKVADFLLLNDRDLTYAKLRIDDRSIETLKKGLGKIDDALTRVLCWSTVWDMTRDGELSASDYLDIAIAGLATESTISTITAVGRQLPGAIDRYLAPKNRDAKQRQVADAIWGILQAAPAGSDSQLQFARIFASVAGEADGTKVHSLLAGGLTGLTIDSDLRWTLANALAGLGAYAKSDLDAVLAMDNTIPGNAAYQKCLAALPDAASKEVIWNSIFSSETGTQVRQNQMFGFYRENQSHLAQPYVDKYFNSLISSWETLGFERGSEIVESMFPPYIITQELLDRTNAWIANEGKDAPATLIRYLSENRDSLARALNAQKKDSD